MDENGYNEADGSCTTQSSMLAIIVILLLLILKFFACNKAIVEHSVFGEFNNMSKSSELLVYPVSDDTLKFGAIFSPEVMRALYDTVFNTKDDFDGYILERYNGGTREIFHISRSDIKYEIYGLYGKVYHKGDTIRAKLFIEPRPFLSEKYIDVW